MKNYVNLFFFFSIFIITRLFSQAAVQNNELPVELVNLSNFAVSLSTEEEARKAVIDLNNMPVEEFEKIKVEQKVSLLTRAITVGHTKFLKDLVKRVINRLAIDGDNPNYTIMFSPSPLPNAGIYPDKALMIINLGLFAFTSNEDEVASVLAHEMTHQNKEHLKAKKDNPETDKFLNTLQGYNDLEPAQREELRADLGSLDRLIKAGYNPWAAYNFEKRLAEWLSKNFDAKLQKKILSIFNKRSFEYMEAHPTPEVRMAAMKAYIMKKGLEEDISDNTKSFTPNSASFWTFRKRMELYSMPFTSIWVQRGILTYWGYQALQALGITDTETAKMIGDAVAPVVKPIGSALGTFGEGIKTILGYIGKPIVGLINVLHLEEHPERILFGMLTPPISFLIWVIRDNIHSDKYYKKFLLIVNKNKKLPKIFNSLKEKQKLNIDLLYRLINLNQASLKILYEIYYDKDTDTALRDFHKEDGLSHALKLSIKNQAQYLKALNLELEGTSKEKRAELLKSMEALLSEIPSFVLENNEVYEAINNLYLTCGLQGFKFDTSLDIEEPTIRTFMRLQTIARAQNLPPETALQLADSLYKEDMISSANAILKSNYSKILEYVFSKENKNPELATLLTDLQERMQKKDKTLKARSFFNKTHWDIKILEARARAKTVLSPFEDVIGQISYSYEVPIDTAFTWFSLRYWLNKADHISIGNFLDKNFTSVSGLREFVENELKTRNVLIDNLSLDFMKAIMRNPQWIKEQKDIDALLDSDYFWPKINGDSSRIGLLERSLVRVVQRNQEKFPSIWKYEPSSSEKLQKLIILKLKDLQLYPKNLEEEAVLWKRLTTRGVTSISDEMFQKLYGTENSDLKSKIEKDALDGRIWDQEQKGKIVEEHMKASKEYNDLLKEKDSIRRMSLIENVVENLKKGFSERGITYVNILEDLSRTINSSPEESSYIEEAKTLGAGGERQEDLGLRVLSDMLDKALNWNRKEQWELIKFLRGEVPASTRITKSFRTIGPERIKRMFDLLPVLARAEILDGFLDSPRGLCGKVKTSGGWSKIIIEHILKDGDQKSKEVAREILHAFLYSLKATGNEALQSYVLSYLLSLPKRTDGGSVGRTLKDVLEIFGATGVKIGQFLVATELLPERETNILRSLQEKAKIPNRETIYEDIREIIGDKEIPFSVKSLLGAASLKYAFLAEENLSGNPIVIKILRLDALAHTRAEFNQLEAMADFLIRKYGARKYGVFKSIVRASRAATERELKLQNENDMSKIASEEIYANRSDENVRVRAPKEILIHPERMMASELAKGVSLYEIKPEYREAIANKILTLERGNLFPKDPVDTSFDPDRHAGNYRVLAERNETGKLDLEVGPIDFGQVQKITPNQRNQVIELFSLAQILKEAGPTIWTAEKICSILEIDPSHAVQIKKKLTSYFPAKNLKPVTAYYSILAALDDFGYNTPIVFYDYIRGIIQLKPYEQFSNLPALETPSGQLENLVKLKVDQFLKEMKLSSSEKMVILAKKFMSDPKEVCRMIFQHYGITVNAH